MDFQLGRRSGEGSSLSLPPLSLHLLGDPSDGDCRGVAEESLRGLSVGLFLAGFEDCFPLAGHEGEGALLEHVGLPEVLAELVPVLVVVLHLEPQGLNPGVGSLEGLVKALEISLGLPDDREGLHRLLHEDLALERLDAAGLAGEGGRGCGLRHLLAVADVFLGFLVLLRGILPGHAFKLRGLAVVDLVKVFHCGWLVDWVVVLCLFNLVGRF